MNKMDRRIIDGTTLLGTAIGLFGIGTIVQSPWQQIVMFGSFFIFLIFSIIAFFEKK
jgi:hypothetical protein